MCIRSIADQQKLLSTETARQRSLVEILEADGVRRSDSVHSEALLTAVSEKKRILASSTDELAGYCRADPVLINAKCEYARRLRDKNNDGGSLKSGSDSECEESCQPMDRKQSVH